jgi:phasin family protein
MNVFPDQITAAGKGQIDSQMHLLRSAAGTAFDSAEKLLALNFDAARASLDHSNSLLRQMAAAKDPRDLLALASQGQSQLDRMLAYQRKLFGLASSLGSSLVGLQAPVTPAASAALEKLASLPAVAETTPPVLEKAAEVTVELIDSASVPLAEPDLPAAAPIAELTPVAAATGHVEAHPSAAPMQEDAPAPAVKTAGRNKKK